jgi:hypothetical protein
MDLVVTNFGLNTKYHAAPDAPALMFYGKFGDEGPPQLIEAEWEDDKLYPIRGRSCSSQAMPFLRQRFKSYHAFALAELNDLYSEHRLTESQRFSATTLESGVLVNHAGLRFEFRPLPTLAQASPGFGVAVSEINGDAWPDLCLAHNFYTPQPETGRMDGGVGLLLHGRKDATFDVQWPSSSGFVVAADAKSLVLADTNGDGLEEIMVGVNDAPLLAFERSAPAEGHLITVRLEGAAGNRTAVGARVTVHTADGSQQTAEIYAGSGYLSQSPATLTFGAPELDAVTTITVRWPDGSTTHEPGRRRAAYIIRPLP